MFSPAKPRSLPQPGHLYDVAVVGAGLAGSELAWRLARSGRDVLLVTQSLDSVGNVFGEGDFPEGTLFAGTADRDAWARHREVKQALEATPGIHLLQSCVSALEAGPPHRLGTWEGPALLANAVVLAAGSFLGARLGIGEVVEEAGRLGEVAYDFLWRDLAARGVAFAAREDGASGEAGSLPYTVRYHTLALGELDGFRVARWPGVYALGRCTPGELDYAATLQRAAELAAEMGGE